MQRKLKSLAPAAAAAEDKAQRLAVPDQDESTPGRRRLAGLRLRTSQMDGGNSFKEVMNDALLNMMHFPPTMQFSDMCKLKALHCLDAGSLSEAAYYFAFSHGVFELHKSLHNYQTAVRSLSAESNQKLMEMNCINRDGARSPYKSPGGILTNSNKINRIFDPQIKKRHHTLSPDIGDNRKVNSVDLIELPKDWVVVQITSLPSICESSVPSTRPMAQQVLTRWECGTKNTPCVVKLAKPRSSGNGVDDDILVQFNKLLVDNKELNTGYTGNKRTYWEKRNSHCTTLKNLVNNLENHLLGPHRSLFQGRLLDAELSKRVLETLDQILGVLSDNHVTLKDADKTTLALLIEALPHTGVSCVMGWLLTAMMSSAAAGSALSKETKVKLRRMLEDAVGVLAGLKAAKRGPVILILDKEIQALPWESLPILENHPVSRVTSVHMLKTLYETHFTSQRSVFKNGINPRNSYYILNPDGSLEDVQQRLESIFKREESWDGIVGRCPNRDEVQSALVNKDVLLYCGHGSGSKYMSGNMVQNLDCNCAVLLMGCSSVQMRVNGGHQFGIVQSYMLGSSPAIVGMLWEVTDFECDRVTLELMSIWLSSSSSSSKNNLDKKAEPELLRAVVEARKGARLFMTSAAMVTYGLPISLNPQ